MEEVALNAKLEAEEIDVTLPAKKILRLVNRHPEYDRVGRGWKKIFLIRDGL